VKKLTRERAGGGELEFYTDGVVGGPVEGHSASAADWICSPGSGDLTQELVATFGPTPADLGRVWLISGPLRPNFLLVRVKWSLLVPYLMLVPLFTYCSGSDPCRSGCQGGCSTPHAIWFGGKADYSLCRSLGLRRHRIDFANSRVVQARIRPAPGAEIPRQWWVTMGDLVSDPVHRARHMRRSPLSHRRNPPIRNLVNRERTGSEIAGMGRISASLIAMKRS
jgi:hypothetical protein